ncbi:putative tRNA pseudouridine synthase Pus10 [Megalops cyprinoides]|uniref:putative tRNA pseudouridine synthase Pus10 n=1 Tax=Megalops cyprinoides TaxID=118141 RepID=UPI00186424A9|nr:putative tRNA pseudouridine synthase Pus10 [Megalops cyprinoides]XP_036411298.1 putative tRNA pseudouridine synthase Pus10 [Megalops cyprinoides]
MLPLKVKDRPIVRALLSAGCCARCILRFCCIGLQSAYRQSYEDLMNELHTFVSAGECGKSHDVPDHERTEDPPCKRVKLDTVEGDTEVVPHAQAESDLDTAGPKVCVVCLGVLQHFCDKTFAKKVSEAVTAEGYQFDSLVLSVSLPAQLSVREHSTWLLVKKEVREKGLCLGKDDVIQVKEAFKWIMNGLVSQELGVPVLAKSPFEVSVGFTHPETDGDCHFLATTCSDCFKPAKNKLSVFTRMAVVKALEKITDENFRRQFPCPPKCPTTRCTAQDIQCLHVSVFVAGRYNKFSRTLPQTPWVIDGERRMESSVEELITAPLLSAFRSEGFNFSSSGREDVDVRTLGNGRPFAVELLNPHRSQFSKEEVRELQEAINKSSDKIRVRDLQIVTRDAVGHMKEGEEEKTKSYGALIWTQRPIEKEDIEFIKDIKELKIAQKTPLRVLHRRPLAVRQRVIHTMTARFLDSHHFQLHLRTQAGTYIKEFVHGDFGRTRPNLCDLMKTDTDILELDVESVDVDWPPAVGD